MSAFPDTRAMLPSMARATLTAWILEQMQAAPTFRYADVLHAMPAEIDGYGWISLAECFESASVEYTLLHAKEPNESTSSQEIR